MVALCVSLGACRPATLGIELPILEDTRALVLGVSRALETRSFAFEVHEDPEGLKAAIDGLDLAEADGVELALYRCGLEALGLSEGTLEPEPGPEGRALPRTRCGLSRRLHEDGEGEQWTHTPGLPEQLRALRVSRGDQRCFPSRVNPECEPEASGASASYAWRAPETSRAVLGSGRVIPLAGRSGEFGWSVALAEDTLVVGAPSDASCAVGVGGAEEDDDGCPDAGAAYVYRWFSAGWRREARLKPSDTHGGQHFGAQVAVSKDAVLVGAHRTSECAPGVPPLPVCLSLGAAYVFRRTDAGWTQEAILTASSRMGSDWFGQGVALRGDWAAVGAPGQDSCGSGPSREDSSAGCTNSGAVYLFQRTREGWKQQWILKAQSPEPFSQLGRRISFAGPLLVAPTASRTQCERDTLSFAIPSPCVRSNMIEIFEETEAGDWIGLDGVRSPVADSNPDYALTGLTDGARVFLGHPGERFCVPDVSEPTGQRCASGGAVHVFERRGGRFVAERTLGPPAPRAGMYFGVSLSAARDSLLVGASGESGCIGPGGPMPCGRVGAAHAFRLGPSGFEHEAELRPLEGTADSSAFGYAVSVSEGFAAVGDPWLGPGEVLIYEP